jgi:hypothetical protein
LGLPVASWQDKVHCFVKIGKTTRSLRIHRPCDWQADLHPNYFRDARSRRSLMRFHPD